MTSHSRCVFIFSPCNSSGFVPYFRFDSGQIALFVIGAAGICVIFLKRFLIFIFLTYLFAKDLEKAFCGQRKTRLFLLAIR